MQGWPADSVPLFLWCACSLAQAKKKAGDEQGAGGGERKAKRKAEGAAGAEGEAGGEPKKKKKKRVEAEALGGAAAVASPPKPKLGIAALAAMQGALATSSTPGTAATPAAGAASAGQCQAPALVQPAVTPKGAAPQQLAALAAGGGEPAAAVAPAAPPSGKKRYQMPEDVRAAVDKVRGVVGAAPQPAEGSKKKLPPELLAELKAFSPLFLRWLVGLELAGGVGAGRWSWWSQLAGGVGAAGCLGLFVGSCPARRDSTQWGPCWLSWPLAQRCRRMRRRPAVPWAAPPRAFSASSPNTSMAPISAPLMSCREQTAAGVSATTPILNAFMEFMEPFASRQSVAVHLKGSQKVGGMLAGCWPLLVAQEGVWRPEPDCHVPQAKPCACC